VVEKQEAKISCLPSPERPVREDDVERLIVAAVPEERWQYGGVLPLVLVSVHDGPVDAVEHEVEVGDAAGVAPEQLQDAPDSEEVARLECRCDALHVGAAPDHDEAEVGGGACAVDHGAGDAPRRAPWVEVLVDEAEVVGAGRGGVGVGGERRRVGDGGAGGGGGGVGGEREVEGLGDVAGYVRVAGKRRRQAGEGVGRPRRRRRGGDGRDRGGMRRGQDGLQGEEDDDQR
jgi:hypothetical protein